jgi:nanoRNase/pAp phosphatase (c-di-AMP/oligoRNAs hydrolase)
MQQLRYIGGMANRTQRGHFQHIIRLARRSGVIITTHDTPDVDALGAAYALQKHLLGKGAVADIVTGKTISLTGPLMEKLGMERRTWSQVGGDGRPVMVVDTNAPSLLTGCSRKEFFAIIDHHEPGMHELEARFRIINKRAVSVCEVVASLIPEGDIDKEMALALAVGIAGDSERLVYADDGTLSIFDRLVDISGESKRSIDALAYPSLSGEEAVAVFNEMRNLRTELHRGRGIAVGASELENPAILATMVRNTGISITAILGLVSGGAASNQNWYKISFRVMNSEVQKGIRASDIARRTSEKCRMPRDQLGGGHVDKAAAVVMGTYDSIVKAVLDAAREAIDRAGV